MGGVECTYREEFAVNRVAMKEEGDSWPGGEITRINDSESDKRRTFEILD